jgi:NCS1 family nucleobase:cation symporter-1
VAAVVGAGATAVGLLIDLTQYESYLYLIGSVFVPLFGVFAVSYYVLRRGEWDVSENARGRWVMTLPWLAGFVSYQLVNPGAVSWWKGIWPAWTPPSWLSATVVALLVSAAGALLVGSITRWRAGGRRRSASVPAEAR